MTDDLIDPVDALTSAARAARTADTASALERAVTGLLTAWRVIGLVDTELDVSGELWWLALAEAVADAIDEVGHIPGSVGLPPGPPSETSPYLLDSAALRAGVRDLLTAVHSALVPLSRQSTMDGRSKLAATMAAAAVARAVDASR